MENVKDTNAFAAYEKAIEGYQFQVGRYNTWMNYYALFVGALFIALYTTWPGSEADCCKCSSTGATTENDVWWLQLLIAAVGWITSLC